MSMPPVRNTGVSSSMLFVLVFICGVGGILAQPQGGFLPRVGVIDNFFLQQDGRIIVTGLQNGSGNVKRFLWSGKDDPSLSVPANLTFGSSSLLLPDGKVLVSGTTSGPKLRRLNPDGSVDPSFNYTGSIGAVNFGLGPNGEVYATDNRIIFRLLNDGARDPNFTEPGLAGGLNFAPFAEIVVQPDGKILVAGTFTQADNAARAGIARFNADGTIDTTFAAPLGGDQDVFTVALQADGKIIIGGLFTITNGQVTMANLARLNADGSLDPTFAVAPEYSQERQRVRAVAVQPDGKIVVGGATVPVPNTQLLYTRARAIRFNSDGSPDTTFSAGRWLAEREARKIVVAADGSLYIGAGGNGGVLERMRTNGTLDTPFARFDFDGDRRTELSVYRPSNNTWYFHNGSRFWTWQFGAAGDQPTPADYDGDANTDVAVWRPSNGTWYWINSSTLTFSYFQWGEPGDRPLPGRSDAGGSIPFIVYRPSTRVWYRVVQKPNGTYDYLYYTPYGNIGDIPTNGAIATPSSVGQNITIYRPSTSTFYLAQTNGLTQATRQLGQQGDVPMVLDIDGDLVYDAATYRPSTGQWSIQLSGSSNANVTYFWGEPGDIPVPADYDGDQRDDIAVYRPSTGNWYILGSAEGWRVQQFGEAGDIPVPSSYLYGLP